MSPEEQLEQAVLTVEKIDRPAEIERLIDDLQAVFAALEPDRQRTATDVLEKLQDKRRHLVGDP